jgi:endonuclease G
MTFLSILSFSIFFSYAGLLAPSGDPLLPHIDDYRSVYSYPGYTLCYDEYTEQPKWVAYELSSAEVVANAASRSNRFKADTLIRTGSATDEDYRKSGYDRGHLAPAADMKFLAEAMADCFYYSNMSPQEPAFNRGCWSTAEAVVRAWAMQNNKVFVITGPIFATATHRSIGPNQVGVPTAYFKVILDYTSPNFKAIGIILQNSDIDQELESSLCTVDNVESITGLDFFADIPDPIEALLESTITPSLWPLEEFSIQQLNRERLSFVLKAWKPTATHSRRTRIAAQA